MNFDKKTKGMLLIAMAVMCGFIAAFLVNSAGKKMAPDTPVLVAAQTIEQGDPLNADAFTEIKLPKVAVPEGYIKPGKDFSNIISANKIVEGDILREAHIVELDSFHPSLFSARLRSLDNPNLRGVEVPIASEIKGLLSGMNSYDRIDIISSKEKESENGSKEVEVKTILRSVPVIGVKTPDTSSDDDKTTIILIVALTEPQVESLVYYKAIGEIHASLRPFGVYDNSVGGN